MQPVSGKKAMLMGIYEVLRRYSDVEHPLSVKFIIEKLQKEYGMEAERKAVGNNIRVLLELGYDISSYQENRKGYYLREREFDDVELRILIDSVADNRCLPQNDARRLVRKLMDLSNVYFADQCRSLSNADYANHQENKEFFFNLEQLERSIRKNQRVSFIYNQYGTDGKLHPVAGDAFIVRPSRILHKDMRYYLLAEKAEGQETFCFRLDCMTSLAVLEEEKAELGAQAAEKPASGGMGRGFPMCSGGGWPGKALDPPHGSEVCRRCGGLFRHGGHHARDSEGTKWRSASAPCLERSGGSSGHMAPSARFFGPGSCAGKCGRSWRICSASIKRANRRSAAKADEREGRGETGKSIPYGVLQKGMHFYCSVGRDAGKVKWAAI